MAVVVDAIVPGDFEVPTRLDTDRYFLKPLHIDDVVKDYLAVASNSSRLDRLMGPEYAEPEILTFEQDLLDVAWHHKEFQRRSSFAYGMWRLDGSACIGGVYIYPPDKGHFYAPAKPGFDAVVFMWVSQDAADDGLDEDLFETVKVWIQDVWPFERYAFPGREPSWEDWLELPDD
jgi:hypothetical protein